MRNSRKKLLYCLLAISGLGVGCGHGAPTSDLAASDQPAARRSEETGQTSTVDQSGAISRTFSIVAVDPATGTCGVAVASKYPAVGAVVPFARGGAGVFCTQHYHNPRFGARALDLLAQDKRPEEILDQLLAEDDRPGHRQLAIIDRHGRTAQHNPVDAGQSSRWWGGMSGRYYACQGNTLTGSDVVTSMAAAYEKTVGSLADRLMAALIDGDCAGGDHRGRLAAAILVARKESETAWLDVRVDQSDDAVIELARQYVEMKHDAKGTWGQGPWQPPCPDRPVPQPPAGR